MVKTKLWTLIISIQSAENVLANRSTLKLFKKLTPDWSTAIIFSISSILEVCEQLSFQY